MDDQSNEEQARSMGWRPQEEFRGDPEKWVPAETFLERGRTYIPLIKKDNERLNAQVGALGQEVQGLRAMLDESKSSIETLREFYSEDAKRRVQAAKAAVREEIARASESGDHARVAEMTEQLTDLQLTEREQKQPAKPDKGEASRSAGTPAGQSQRDFSQEQWYKDWHAENEWYGKELVKTAVANMVVQHLRTSGVRDVERAFLDKATAMTNAEMERITGESGGRRLDKVEGSVQHGSQGGSTKGWSSLPADAKEACLSQIPRMVGPKGKPFKTEAEWKAHFVSYYQE